MPDLVTPAGALALWALMGYLAGSIPFGILVARMMGLGDLRRIGSGNIGATNVLRTGNKTAAAATLLLDAAKGAAVVLFVRAVAAEDAVQVAGAAAFLGHCFPVWLRFKGGKGVATFLGILIAYHWPLGLIACAIWLAMAFALRISSLSALVAAAASPLVALLVGRPGAIALCLVLAILIFARHRANIERLLAGTESRIGR
ncbi:glycerol-3-phosphate 1-O-acyltransferase PlsY [Wenxinia saemankumensis]|uniref:Glycerol-3-phosphate acyltransferase n=1 Tax=Wenxinia saemankumensis TaxID=1447782 RepID=A0A1M6FYC5_9RHOB|nr:glycerol-3-phosphate 1-O-acyltransferase PlsY [Wenxinia saemankumensis]SHJ02711.1 acyl-phosphate glycerol-3-phosphate acyltransferase [Wenxinia saemankumensis]